MRGDAGPGPLTDTKSNGMVHNPREREVSTPDGMEEKVDKEKCILDNKLSYTNDFLSENILKRIYMTVWSNLILLLDAFKN